MAGPLAAGVAAAAAAGGAPGKKKKGSGSQNKPKKPFVFREPPSMNNSGGPLPKNWKPPKFSGSSSGTTGRTANQARVKAGKNFYSGDDEQSKFLRSVGVSKQRKDLTDHDEGLEGTRKRWKAAHNKQHKGTDKEVLEFNKKTGKAVSIGSSRKYHKNIQDRLAKDEAATKAYRKHSAAGGGGKAAFEKEFKDHEYDRRGQRRHAKTKHGNRVARDETGGTDQQHKDERDRQSKQKIARLNKIKDTKSAKYKQLMHEWKAKHGGTHDAKTGNRKKTP